VGTTALSPLVDFPNVTNRLLGANWRSFRLSAQRADVLHAIESASFQASAPSAGSKPSRGCPLHSQGGGASCGYSAQEGPSARPSRPQCRERPAHSPSLRESPPPPSRCWNFLYEQNGSAARSFSALFCLGHRRDRPGLATANPHGQPPASLLQQNARACRIDVRAHHTQRREVQDIVRRLYEHARAGGDQLNGSLTAVDLRFECH